MSAIQRQVLAASENYSSRFNKSHLDGPPAKKHLVLACMDARIDPAQAFGIELGDAHVIRNAGASAVDGLRSIVISEQMLGTTEVVLVKHTRCGMLNLKNEDAYALIDRNLGTDACNELRSRHIDFMPFSEVEQAVRDDVTFLRGSKLVPDNVTVSGWVYEVETGKTRRVEG